MLAIPDELKCVFEKYKGTGIFTVGAVSEFVHRWNLLKLANDMDLYQWISRAVELSEKTGKIRNRKEYLDENIDLWIDIWRYANDGMVHFSRKNAIVFQNEGLLEIKEKSVYDYNGVEIEGKNDDLIFDMVEFKVNCKS